MTSPYKRRRPSILRNFWIYRRLVLVACVLGLLLWFTWANDEKVKVFFPFGLGQVRSSIGVIILASAMVGSVVTALVATLIWAFKVRKGGRQESHLIPKVLKDEDLPPPDYAAKTGEGLTGTRWPN